ncbi:hypothetical protein DESC_290124 [Desulfosarcina cetonica]|nr:hypothetical protein DESC_290124 [Desulfosarcina cetonica]
MPTFLFASGVDDRFSSVIWMSPNERLRCRRRSPSGGGRFAGSRGKVIGRFGGGAARFGDGVHDILGTGTGTGRENAFHIGQGGGDFGPDGINEVIGPYGHRTDAGGIPRRKHAHGKHGQVVLGRRDAPAELILVMQDHIAVVAGFDIGNFGLDEIDPHGLGVLVELLIAFAEGPDIHIIDGDVRQGQGAGEQHGLFDGVHAAHPRAVGNAHALVAGTGTLNVSDVVRFHSVGRPEHAVVGAVGGEQTFHLQGVDGVGDGSAPVLGLVRHGAQVKAGGEDGGARLDDKGLRLLEVVDGPGGADGGAFPAEHAVIGVEDGELGDGVGKGNRNGLGGAKAALLRIGNQYRAIIFALAAADALVRIHVSGTLNDLGAKFVAVSIQGLEIAVGEQGDVCMMRRRRHFGGRDATGAIQGGKHLGQANHLAADGCVFFDNRHAKSLVGQIQGRLQAGDAAADNQCVETLYRAGFHHFTFLSRLPI